ncbi:hypothetical protein J3459_018091 [Metarhizium acridum]|nr:hypothetical protein J3459_018091 [Metarhizium acridum]
MATSNTAEYEDVFRAALFLEAGKGILNLVEILFDLFAEDPKDNDGQTCLHIASIHNQPHVVDFLLGRGVHVNVRRQDGRTPWTVIGSSPSHEAISNLLIQAGARVNDTRPTDEMNCLYQAAASKHSSEKELIHHTERLFSGRH